MCNFLFSFLGIGIVSDLFMGAIEKITSKTKQVAIASAGDDGPDVIEYPVWNGTVANLTLMALGKHDLLINEVFLNFSSKSMHTKYQLYSSSIDNFEYWKDVL